MMRGIYLCEKLSWNNLPVYRMHDEPPFFLLTQLEYITVDEQTFGGYTNITELNSQIKKMCLHEGNEACVFCKTGKLHK